MTEVLTLEEADRRRKEEWVTLFIIVFVLFLIVISILISLTGGFLFWKQMVFG